MPDRYQFDPPSDISLKDVTDLLRAYLMEIDKELYMRAPENVRRLFRPSILTPSPSKKVH
jgi:hypothetical protein